MRSCQRGFTLIELLVVAVLLAMLASILYGTISGILQGRALIENQRETGRVAQYVFERMSRELAGRVLTTLQDGQNNQGSQQSDQTGTPNPYQGTSRRFFIGVSGKSGSADKDSLRFATATAAQAFFGGVPNYGLVEVQYRLDETPAELEEEEEKQERSEHVTYVLVREEIPAEVTTKETLDRRRLSVPLAEGVVALNFRYLKDGKWENEWNEQTARLPEAVEISLVLKGTDNALETYRTAVGLTRRQRSRLGGLGQTGSGTTQSGIGGTAGSSPTFGSTTN